MSKKVSEAVCVEILMELGNCVKEDYLIQLRKKFNLTNDEMDKICEKCPNYPE